MTDEEVFAEKELREWVLDDVMKWPEWHGLQSFSNYEPGFLFNTKSGDYSVTKSVALSEHLPSTYIFTCSRLSFNEADPYYADIIPFHWRLNNVKQIYQLESTVGESNNFKKLITDKDIVPVCKVKMKEIAKDFDKYYKFILSHEDKFVEWNNMLLEARKFYAKIQKNFNAELRANGDFK
jgi:hypothetical protein